MMLKLPLLPQMLSKETNIYVGYEVCSLLWGPLGGMHINWERKHLAGSRDWNGESLCLTDHSPRPKEMLLSFFRWTDSQ